MAIKIIFTVKNNIACFQALLKKKLSGLDVRSTKIQVIQKGPKSITFNISKDSFFELLSI